MYSSSCTIPCLPPSFTTFDLYNNQAEQPNFQPIEQQQYLPEELQLPEETSANQGTTPLIAGLSGNANSEPFYFFHDSGSVHAPLTHFTFTPPTPSIAPSISPVLPAQQPLRTPSQLSQLVFRQITRDTAQFQTIQQQLKNSVLLIREQRKKLEKADTINKKELSEAALSMEVGEFKKLVDDLKLKRKKILEENACLTDYERQLLNCAELFGCKQQIIKYAFFTRDINLSKEEVSNFITQMQQNWHCVETFFSQFRENLSDELATAKLNEVTDQEMISFISENMEHVFLIIFQLAKPAPHLILNGLIEEKIEKNLAIIFNKKWQWANNKLDQERKKPKLNLKNTQLIQNYMNSLTSALSEMCTLAKKPRLSKKRKCSEGQALPLRKLRIKK